VREVVLDASVVLKWFRRKGEQHAEAAQALRAAYEGGELVVLVPSLLFLELINVAGRRWKLAEEQLLELAAALQELGFDLIEPELPAVARWTARGLTAYDAAYVAVAERAATTLVTDDELVLSTAPELAVALGGFHADGGDRG
jgi:predicted nucleic acid-binding protein